jgi:hypothetical protein
MTPPCARFGGSVVVLLRIQDEVFRFLEDASDKLWIVERSAQPDSAHESAEGSDCTGL